MSVETEYRQRKLKEIVVLHHYGIYSCLEKGIEWLIYFLCRVSQYLERSTVEVVLSLIRSPLVPLSLNWFHTLLFLQIYFNQVLESQVIHGS